MLEQDRRDGSYVVISSLAPAGQIFLALASLPNPSLTYKHPQERNFYVDVRAGQTGRYKYVSHYRRMCKKDLRTWSPSLLS